MFNRREIKARAKTLTRGAQASAFAVTGVLLGIGLVLRLIDTLVSGNTYESLFAAGLPGVFVNILASLIILVLQAGFYLYALAVYRGERTEILTLFDGFSFVGKLILLMVQEAVFIYLWSMLFLIPGIIAAYRYRFAIFNLCENPDITPGEAIRMSKAQTQGAKMELFILDVSFAGWILLASLPSIALNILAINGIAIPLPVLVVSLISGVFSALVDLWRLPYQTLSLIGYFAVCKHVSGIGAGAASKNPTLPSGEDENRYF